MITIFCERLSWKILTILFTSYFLLFTFCLRGTPQTPLLRSPLS